VRIVKPTFLTVIAFIAVIAFLALFLADREMQAGIERLSHYKFAPRSALDPDPGLKRVGRRSPSVRAEREPRDLPQPTDEQGSEQ
jgi:hypothetical protein